MEFGDVESCVKDFSELGAEYTALEVSVLKSAGTEWYGTIVPTQLVISDFWNCI